MSDGFFEQRSLWVHGEGGYFLYRIPAMVTALAGTVLAFCEARKNTGTDYDDIDLVMRRSNDGGLSWESQQIVVAGEHETCGNPCPIVDEDTGIVWLLFCKNNQLICSTFSEDCGLTWSEPREITATTKDSNWAFVGTGPCQGIQLQSGRLLAPAWCDESPGLVKWRPKPSWGKIQSSYTIYSDDHGESWSRGAMLTRNASDECAVVETEDGAVYLNARSRCDINRRAFSWSYDGGATWSPVEYDKEQPEPSCQGSLRRLTKHSTSSKSRILLVHPSDTKARCQLTIRMSSDECQSWPLSKVITKGPASYSDLTNGVDDTILCLYESERKLILVRFDLAWLTKCRDV